MKFYIASRFSRRHEANALAQKLKAQGHEITSRWVLADAVVSLMELPRNNGRGGRHVEFGYALGLGKLMFIIGPRETVFHHLDEVRHFDTSEEFLAHTTSEGYF